MAKTSGMSVAHMQLWNGYIHDALTSVKLGVSFPSGQNILDPVIRHRRDQPEAVVTGEDKLVEHHSLEHFGDWNFGRRRARLHVGNEEIVVSPVESSR